MLYVLWLIGAHTRDWGSLARLHTDKGSTPSFPEPPFITLLLHYWYSITSSLHCCHTVVLPHNLLPALICRGTASTRPSSRLIFLCLICGFGVLRSQNPVLFLDFCNVSISCTILSHLYTFAKFYFLFSCDAPHYFFIIQQSLTILHYAESCHELRFDADTAIMLSSLITIESAFPPPSTRF
jgi:hypothetical protein